jgi:hypothetical protein
LFKDQLLVIVSLSRPCGDLRGPLILFIRYAWPTRAAVFGQFCRVVLQGELGDGGFEFFGRLPSVDCMGCEEDGGCSDGTTGRCDSELHGRGSVSLEPLSHFVY